LYTDAPVGEIYKREMLMVLLSNSECNTWLTKNGYNYESADRGAGIEGYAFPPDQCLNFVLPDEARTLLLLSRRLANWLIREEVLLWFTSWALYTDDEMAVVNQLRNAGNAAPMLIDTPGHLFSSSEQQINLLADLILCIMAFEWNGFALQVNRNSSVGCYESNLLIWCHERSEELAISEVIQTLIEL
jgi:hypothetical protein